MKIKKKMQKIIDVINKESTMHLSIDLLHDLGNSLRDFLMKCINPEESLIKATDASYSYSYLRCKLNNKYMRHSSKSSHSRQRLTARESSLVIRQRACIMDFLFN